MEYDEDDFLNLAGIQHFAFCRRQWALIHIEQQWKDNFRTVEGEIMHEKAHDENFVTKRNGVVVTRGMPVFSKTLGINGICDVVEFVKSESGVHINGMDGKYLPIPIEYKRGEPKECDCDRLQLCAQAMCLEGMLLCDVEKGFLYYGTTRRREEVVFSTELREQVIAAAEEMHRLYQRKYTPKVKTSKKCKACSLAEVCVPQLCKNVSAKDYMKKILWSDSE